MTSFFLLPAAQNTDKSALEPEEVKKIVEELRPDFDYILLDCPAGIEQGIYERCLRVPIKQLSFQLRKFHLFVMQTGLLVYWNRRT